LVDSRFWNLCLRHHLIQYDGAVELTPGFAISHLEETVKFAEITAPSDIDHQIDFAMKLFDIAMTGVAIIKSSRPTQSFSTLGPTAVDEAAKAGLLRSIYRTLGFFSTVSSVMVVVQLA
jgi:hypothetical protein